MSNLYEQLNYYSQHYKKMTSDRNYGERYRLPSGTFFLEDGSILALPREDGDSRYPYGEDGFNFWTYASGYMHCNEGLFSPFLRALEGGEPKIAFFASFEKEGSTEKEVVPLLGVPIISTSLEVVRYTIFTSGATYYFCEVKGLTFLVRVAVDATDQVYFSIAVKPSTEETSPYQLSYYINPFVKNALNENSVDRWFRTANYLVNEEMGSFIVEAYEEVDRSTMAPNIGILQMTGDQALKNQLQSHQITTSRYDFVGGSRSSLHTPRALLDGEFQKAQASCTFTETAIMGGILNLEGTSSHRVDFGFSYCFEDVAKEEILGKSLSIEGIDQRVVLMETKDQKKQQILSFDFGESDWQILKPEVMNRFMPQLKKQVEFCSTIKGYIQLSSFSLIGIRDIFQALEGLIYYDQDTARAKILEALNFITVEGRCPRQYILPKKMGDSHSMDLRPFIDQGVWVISTIMSYLKLTKDYELLKATCGYYEFLDEEKHLAKQSQVTSSVGQHMIDVMSYLLKNRDIGHTECIFALYGDWNDALDGLGKSNKTAHGYGTGVSVMATLQVYQNLSEMIALEAVLDSSFLAFDVNLSQSYKTIKGQIRKGLLTYAVVEHGDERKILHGWGDQYSYQVCSFKDPDGVSRDGLTSNAFWILSDMIQEEPTFIDPIIKAFKKLESKYGYKTFEPHFEKNSQGVGRIGNLPPGTAENGAAYSHASLFGIMALFKIGESNKAWKELVKVMPFTHDHISCSPFVMPNSYGYNEAYHIDGESMSDWQTGSSNVLLKTLIKYVAGFEPSYEGVVIQPADFSPFREMTFKVSYKGKLLEIHISSSEAERTFKVNGSSYEGVFDPMMKIKKLWLKDEWLTSKVCVIEIIG